jgi:hypothetical protein
MCLQHGAGEMVAGAEEDVQPAGRREPAHDPGVPAVVGGDHADVRQRRHVERPVQPLGAPLPRRAGLHQRHLAGAVAARRVQHAGGRAPVRQSRRAADAAVLQPRALIKQRQISFPLCSDHPFLPYILV